VCVLKLTKFLVVMEVDHLQNKGLQTHMAILLCSDGLQVFLLLLFTYLTLDALVSMRLTLKVTPKNFINLELRIKRVSVIFKLEPKVYFS